MKGYIILELSYLIDELRFKGFLNENDEILMCDILIKKLFSNEVEVFIILFK